MEHLRTCPTNVQVISEFDIIRYYVYTVTSAEDNAQSSPESRVQATAFLLQENGVLAARDISRALLWCIEYGESRSSDTEAKAHVATAKKGGFGLSLLSKGELRAIELAKLPSRSSNLTQTRQGQQFRNSQTNQPATPGSVGIGETRHFDSTIIYEMFMSAIVTTLRLTLCADGGFTPINARTFVCHSQKDSAKAPSTDCTICVTLNTNWSASGNLIVYWTLYEDTRISPLVQHDISRYSSTEEILLRVAPSGAIAVITQSELSSQSPVKVEERDRRKRPRVNRVKDEKHIWKRHVEEFLRCVGIELSGLELESKWVKIRLSRDEKEDQADQKDPAQLLWPIDLCFAYHDSTPMTKLFESTDELDYTGSTIPRPASIKTGDNPRPPMTRTANLDSLEIAQTWFLEKADREKHLKTSKNSADSTSQPLSSVDLNSGSLPGPSSPLYLRAGTLGDLQPVGGVYPTPPDAIQNQNLASSASTEILSISGVITGADATQLPLTSKPISSSVEGVNSSEAGNVNSSTDVPRIQVERQDKPGNVSQSDELFEDMDEDVYVGNNVTDADFSFFDEPDDDETNDIMEMDEIQSEDQKVEADTSAGADVHDIKGLPGFQPNVTEPSVKPEIETLEPESINGASSPPIGNQPPSPSWKEPVEDSHHNPMQQNSSVDEVHEPFPGFNHKLNMPRNTMVSRKESIFDAVNLNEQSILTNTKYSAGRFKLQSNPSSGDTDHVVELQTPSYQEPKLSSVLQDRTKQHSQLAQPALKLGMFNERMVDDSDNTSTWSESASDEDDGDDVFISTGDMDMPTSATIQKRKWALEDQSTPASAASPSATSHSGEKTTFENVLLSHSDPAQLTILEPSPWDWSLSIFPKPAKSPASIFDRIIGTNQAGSQTSTSASSEGGESSPKESTYSANTTWTKKDAILIAQLFSDQIINSCLKMLPCDQPRLSAYQGDLPFSKSASHATLDKLRETVRRRFQSATDCTLSRYASLCDPLPESTQSTKSQQRPLARRTNTGPEIAGITNTSIFPITAPHIRVRRADSLWDLLPPALRYWESLGLGPVSESKNVMAYCIFPERESVKDAVNTFLDNISLAYEGCRLGSHVRGVRVEAGDILDGLVPCQISPNSTFESMVHSFRSSCADLGAALCSLDAEQEDEKKLLQTDTFVVYMVNPFESTQGLWELCAAFSSLSHSYRHNSDCDENPWSNIDVVLQIIPIAYLASAETPVVLDQSQMARLSREVYDRCQPNGPSGDRFPLHIYMGPSIHLEESLPRNIPFKTNVEPAADLLRENSHMHVGYSMTTDESWVTAAWTDSFGKYQACATYYLGGGRPFLDIAREVWQTTQEIISKRKVLWRICIARAGIMERDELDAWGSIAMQPSQGTIFTALLSVNADAPLSLYPPIAFMNPMNAPNSTGLPSTPVGTPQPGVSPDTHGPTPAATPSEFTQDMINDADARLVDATDDTWGIMLAHRINNSNSIPDCQPSFASGLIIKRGTDRTLSSSQGELSTDQATEGPCVLGVNLLWLGVIGANRNGPPTPVASPLSQDSQNLPGQTITGQSSGLMSAQAPNHRTTAEMLLKEIIIQYRGLGLLAKSRNMKGSKNGIIPWHICAAMRSIEGFEHCAPH